MRDYRIEFDSVEPFMGNMVTRRRSTKWMTWEEMICREGLITPFKNPKIIERGDRQ